MGTIAIRAALALLALTLLAVPADAGAASLMGKPLEKALWGPTRLEGVSQFPRYRELGVTIHERTVRWDQIAPSRPADPTNPDDPAYKWPEDTDFAVREARLNGLDVLFAVLGTPNWANGNLGWSRPPDRVQDYADFVTAVARRYPTVRRWMIWVEPLRNINFVGYPRDRPSRVKLARIYAQVLDAAYGALKKESKRNLVIGGNTFTTDRKPVYWAPVPLYEWMRLLRLPNGKVPRMDLWGHNPFTVRKPAFDNPPGKPLGDVSDIRRVLKKLNRLVSRPLGRKLPVFISEFCIPEGKSDLFPTDLSTREQLSWLRTSYALVRRERQIWGFGWWLFQDNRPDPGEKEQLITCGLVDTAGQPKPVFDVFRRLPRARR